MLLPLLTKHWSRVITIEGPLADLASLEITTIAESAEETLAGLKQVLRQILLGSPKGLKLSQVASGYKDKTGVQPRPVLHCQFPSAQTYSYRMS